MVPSFNGGELLLLGLASGLLLTAALAVINGDNATRLPVRCGRSTDWSGPRITQRIANSQYRLRPVSTLQTATGIAHSAEANVDGYERRGIQHARVFSRQIAGLRALRQGIFRSLAFVVPIAMVVISITHNPVSRSSRQPRSNTWVCSASVGISSPKHATRRTSITKCR